MKCILYAALLALLTAPAQALQIVKVDFVGTITEYHQRGGDVPYLLGIGSKMTGSFWYDLDDITPPLAPVIPGSTLYNYPLKNMVLVGGDLVYNYGGSGGFGLRVWNNVDEKDAIRHWEIILHSNGPNGAFQSYADLNLEGGTDTISDTSLANIQNWDKFATRTLRVRGHPHRDEVAAYMTLQLDPVAQDQEADTAVAPVPEPSTLALLGSGLFGFFWKKRKNKI